MLPLHKKYQEYELHSRGRVDELEDVRPFVAERWPGAREEGSAGLARMYTNPEGEFVAYAWGSPNWATRPRWNYLVFNRGYDW